MLFPLYICLYFSSSKLKTGEEPTVETCSGLEIIFVVGNSMNPTGPVKSRYQHPYPALFLARMHCAEAPGDRTLALADSPSAE